MSIVESAFHDDDPTSDVVTFATNLKPQSTIKHQYNTIVVTDSFMTHRVSRSENVKQPSSKKTSSTVLITGFTG